MYTIKTITLTCAALALLAMSQARAADEPAPAAASPEAQQEESYQRVYEAFTKLLQNVGNSSLGNARRLVSRLNQLVGAPSSGGSGEEQAQKQPQPQPQAPAQANKEQSIDERTDQILNRLDKVTKETDQSTLRQLNDDVGRLIGTLNDSYLRNIRRVIERVNKMVGSAPSAGHLHQQGDRLGEDGQRLPGFPGWDEFIVAVDRMQKSLASFVRSSTKLITSG